MSLLKKYFYEYLKLTPTDEYYIGLTDSASIYESTGQLAITYNIRF